MKSQYEYGHPVREPYTGNVSEHECYKGKVCPKCKQGEIVEYDGGDQGGVAFEYCENNDCDYEKR